MKTTKPSRSGQLLVAGLLAIVATAGDWGAATAPQHGLSRGIAEAAPNTDADDGATVWGTIKRYTNDHIVVNGRTYRFSKTVVIDTYSLKPDDRGNVRLALDERGRVTHVFFYGIDMPDVVRRYKM